MNIISKIFYAVVAVRKFRKASADIVWGDLGLREAERISDTITWLEAHGTVSSYFPRLATKLSSALDLTTSIHSESVAVARRLIEKSISLGEGQKDVQQKTLAHVASILNQVASLGENRSERLKSSCSAIICLSELFESDTFANYPYRVDIVAQVCSRVVQSYLRTVGDIEKIYAIWFLDKFADNTQRDFIRNKAFELSQTFWIMSQSPTDYPTVSEVISKIAMHSRDEYLRTLVSNPTFAMLDRPETQEPLQGRILH